MISTVLVTIVMFPFWVAWFAGLVLPFFALVLVLPALAYMSFTRKKAIVIARENWVDFGVAFPKLRLFSPRLVAGLPIGLFGSVRAGERFSRAQVTLKRGVNLCIGTNATAVMDAAAYDVILVNNSGKAIPMGLRSKLPLATSNEVRNRKVLSDVMRDTGFVCERDEWWSWSLYNVAVAVS
ncbi:MAG: hypothetical protein AAB425_13725 [Bdellovibrionota bacterium]